MLIELHIKNIAIIEEVNIEFGGGFNVLTGETGAGKSILIDSINMAIGGRANRELVRTGAEKATVDAAFEVSPSGADYLEGFGVEAEDGIIVLSRELSADGKSKSRINGRIVPLSVVKEVGAKLIAIHGQMDNRGLLQPRNHIDFVDKYANNAELLAEYRGRYNKVKKIRQRLNEISTDETEKERRLDLIRFQMNEIESANLTPGEEEELEKKREMFQNLETIVSGTNSAYENLYGDMDNTSAYDLISDAAMNLEKAAAHDESLNANLETLNSIVADVEDVSHNLKSYLDAVDYESGEIEYVEDRLSVIYDLKRKYGASIEAILEFYDNISKQANDITNMDEIIAELKDELSVEEEAMKISAEKLTQSRIAAGKKLSSKIMRELADLDMNKVKFDVRIDKTDFNINGNDDLEFIISTNPGEGMKPLSKIASGGEMSRIMLAIKSILSDSDDIETLIFDEIDTGVSGRAAQKIAEKICMLSKNRQVLCITHLAQIAGMADTHFKIEKDVSRETVCTSVSKLSEDERKEELARIIGGVTVTDLTLKAAEEMLNLAEELKAKR